MTSLDKKIMLALVIVALLGSLTVVVLRILVPRGERASIEVDNVPVQTIILTPGTEMRTLTIKGRLGDSIIGVNGDEVFMIDSACPDKVCVHMGHKSQRGDIIVCLPNRVVIRILGEPEYE